MIALAALPLVPAVLSGWLLARLLVPLPRCAGGALVRSSLGVGLGLALASCWTFVWLLAAGRLDRGLIVLEVALLGIVILVGRKRPALERADAGGWSRPEVAAGVVLLLAVATAIAIFVVQSLSEPHGFWDAWAIWNQRARFLVRAGTEWRRAFADELLWSHPDYPLLLPLLVARGWTYAGAETTWVPILTGATFTLATAGLLVGLVGTLRGRFAGLVAGTVLLGTSLFALQGAYQCADVPFSFYFLGALGCLALEGERAEGAWRLALLSGLLAGCAAWTKNEGALLVACMLAVRTGSALLRRAPGAWARTGCFVLGSLVPLGFVGVFRLLLATPNDLVEEQRLDHLLATLVDPGRYAGVLAAVGRLAIGELGPALAVVVLAILLLGVPRSRAALRSVAAPALVLALVTLGYFLVYVTTPKPFEWHLATSLSRVTLQLWPGFLLCAFLVPERAPS